MLTNPQDVSCDDCDADEKQPMRNWLAREVSYPKQTKNYRYVATQLAGNWDHTHSTTCDCVRSWLSFVATGDARFNPDSLSTPVQDAIRTLEEQSFNARTMEQALLACCQQQCHRRPLKLRFNCAFAARLQTCMIDVKPPGTSFTGSVARRVRHRRRRRKRRKKKNVSHWKNKKHNSTWKRDKW